ncbi:sensor histidine kinase [Flavobacteriaceae bacterium M23B6Z8]
MIKLTKEFENQLQYSQDKALELFDQIEEVASNVNTLESKALLNYVKSLRYLKVDKVQDSAIQHAKKAYAAHKRLNDSLSQIKDINLLYKCFLAANERDSVFYYASKELELAELIGNIELQARANLDMGDVYYLTRQYDKVKSFRNRALSLAKNHGSKRLLADTHLKVGQTYINLSKKRTKKDLDSAVYHGYKALFHAKEINYDYGIYHSTVVLADFLNTSKRHQEALQLIETITSLPQDKVPLNYGYNAPFYYATILKDNKKYEQAKTITQQLLKSSPKEDFSRRKALNYFLSVLYAYNQQPDSTDYAIKQAIIASNAQDVAKINAGISQLQTQYETKEKEQEIKILEQNERLKSLEIKELQRQRLILGYALLVPLVLIITGGWYWNRRRLKLQLVTEQTENAIKLSELRALRSQMNPHFIFNALNSIQEYIFSNDRTLASSYLVKFSRLIRMYLEHSKVLEISIAEEIEALKLYLFLENSRMDNELHYTIKVDEKLNINQNILPPLFIQPYVENAIKHGLLHKKGQKELSISFSYNEADNTLDISITDNGIGIEASKNYNRNRPYKSFATEANAHRLELMNFKRTKKISLKIINLTNNSNEAAGTEARIKIPL